MDPTEIQGVIQRMPNNFINVKQKGHSIPKDLKSPGDVHALSPANSRKTKQVTVGSNYHNTPDENNMRQNISPDYQIHPLRLRQHEKSLLDRENRRLQETDWAQKKLSNFERERL